MPDPFKRITVDILTTNNKVIYWELDNRFQFDSVTPEFHVDISRSTTEWVEITDTALIGVTSYTDTEQRRFSSKFDFYYRVRCDDNGTEYTSEVVPASGFLNRRMYLHARNILRQLYKRSQSTDAGVPGYLLKIKEFGTECPDCTDFATGDVTNAQCSTCYGTGIVGGYYTAMEDYYVDMSPIKLIDEEVKKPLASKDDQVRQAGMVYFPFLKPKDIFIEKHQNRRYRIDKIQPVIELAGVPMYSIVQLYLLPATRVEYEISV